MASQSPSWKTSGPAVGEQPQPWVVPQPESYPATPVPGSGSTSGRTSVSRNACFLVCCGATVALLTLAVAGLALGTLSRHGTKVHTQFSGSAGSHHATTSRVAPTLAATTPPPAAQVSVPVPSNSTTPPPAGGTQPPNQ